TLNLIIRLQAILEMTNKTARALDLLANQATQMQTIFQHCMVLDYLLVEEGDVCGKS
ncbi:ENR1 protein, partial [Anhinga rufa]|nr:ENR1 protein [Anhinga rufa]